jgi:hypothetical protein
MRKEERMSEDPVPPNERVNIVIRLDGPKSKSACEDLLKKIRTIVEAEGLTIGLHREKK